MSVPDPTIPVPATISPLDMKADEVRKKYAEDKALAEYHRTHCLKDAIVSEPETDIEATPDAGAVPETTILGRDGRPLKIEQTWLREDWAPLLRMAKYMATRNVKMNWTCGECQYPLLAVEVDVDGSSLVECLCTRRRWRP